MGWVVSFAGWPAVHNFGALKKHQTSMGISTNIDAQVLSLEAFS